MLVSPGLSPRRRQCLDDNCGTDGSRPVPIKYPTRRTHDNANQRFHAAPQAISSGKGNRVKKFSLNNSHSVLVAMGESDRGTRVVCFSRRNQRARAQLSETRRFVRHESCISSRVRSKPTGLFDQGIREEVGLQRESPIDFRQLQRL
jgi:hypothetical protein